MNIQTTSPMLPSTSRVGALVDDKSVRSSGASGEQQTRRPTRMQGRNDLHATFIYSAHANPQSPQRGEKIDEYV